MMDDIDRVPSAQRFKELQLGENDKTKSLFPNGLVKAIELFILPDKTSDFERLNRLGSKPGASGSVQGIGKGSNDTDEKGSDQEDSDDEASVADVRSWAQESRSSIRDPSDVD